MEYNLDVENVYYTNEDLVDQGILSSYTIDLDLADEKDFRVSLNEFLLSAGCFWYVENTELGGIVDAFESDSGEGIVEYTGRSWRGILHNIIIDDESKVYQGTIQEIVSEILEDYNMLDLFVMDSSNTQVELPIEDFFTVSPTSGVSLYDTLVNLEIEADISFSYIFYATDKKLHILYAVRQDYTEYLLYTDIANSEFTVSVDSGVPNHLYLIGTEDNSVSTVKNIYAIHLFLDENETLQPYAIVDDPMYPEDYILDKSQQQLFGSSELAEFVEVSLSPSIKYRQVTSDEVDNWNLVYSLYAYKEYLDESEIVEGEDPWNWQSYEPISSVAYYALESEPSDWKQNYTSYYTRTYDTSTGDWNYSSVSEEREFSSARAVTKLPKDWNWNYGDYYYKFQTGTEIEYKQYSADSKDTYVKMKTQPSDWQENFSSYYRKKSKKVNGKTTVTYESCKADEDGKKNRKFPIFKNHNRYRKDTSSVPPKFDKNNTYRILNKISTPDWVKDKYFYAVSENLVPDFQIDNTYEVVYDYYDPLVQEGLNHLEDLKKTSSQTMVLNEFQANIGDTVGGRDEFTGILIKREVSNITVTVDNGLIGYKYVINNNV